MAGNNKNAGKRIYSDLVVHAHHFCTIRKGTGMFFIPVFIIIYSHNI
jgi:hypothetical protein